MRLPHALLVLLAAVFAGVLGARSAPDFSFDRSWNTPDGKTSLSDYRGDFVLVEVWATW